MRFKLLLLLLLPLSACAQSWQNVGNALQRQPTSKGYFYRFNLGAPGFVTWYTSHQVDSLNALIAAHPAGSNQWVQFNDHNVFGATPNLIWNGFALVSSGQFLAGDTTSSFVRVSNQDVAWFHNGNRVSLQSPSGGNFNIFLPSAQGTLVIGNGDPSDVILGDGTYAPYSGGGGGTTTNPITFNNSGSGAASGTTFNGATAPTISWNTLNAVPFTGANATVNLNTQTVLAGAGTFSGQLGSLRNNIGTTSTPGLFIDNLTPTTSGSTLQYTPNETWVGHVWNTSGTPADNEFDFKLEGRAISGSAPITRLYWGSFLNSGGFTDRMMLDNSGQLSLLTGSLYSNFTSGTAGTDSVIVSHGGVLRKISPTYYGTGSSSFYQTFQTNGTPLTQRTVANFGYGFVLSDVSSKTLVVADTANFQHTIFNPIANQTTVSATPGNIFIGTVQDIGTASNVKFGSLGLGTGSTAATGMLQTATTSTSTIRGAIFDQYSTDANGSKIFGRKARGTFASPTVITTGDNLFGLNGAGYDGANFIDATRILSTSIGTISTGIVPGTLTFQTANSSGTLTNGLFIDQAQILTFGHYTTNGGLFFGNGTGIVSQSGAITGIIKGNGTSAPTAATAGTDYQAPISLTTTGSGAATFVANVLNIPTPSAGFTNPMTTLGDIIYGGTSGTATRLAGNTTTTNKFLTQTGTGSVSAAPAYFDLFGTNNSWATQSFTASNINMFAQFGANSTAGQAGSGWITQNANLWTGSANVTMATFLKTVASTTVNLKAYTGVFVNEASQFSTANNAAMLWDYQTGNTKIGFYATGAVGDSLLTSHSGGYVGRLAASAIPQTQASADLTAQTSAGNITTFTVGAATATFNISAYLNITAVTVDVVETQVTYTDENSTSQTANFFTQGATSALLSAIGNSVYPPMTIRAKNGTTITVKSTLTTGTGSITFDAGARITML